MTATPARAVRIPDGMWTALVDEADRCGMSTSQLVRRILAAYLATP